MRKTYMILTIIGTILLNILVIRESLNIGNYLLYTHPLETFPNMFANDVASSFAPDLLFIVVMFLTWTYRESKRLSMKRVWLVWAYTSALSIAGGLQLFLWLSAKHLNA